jgi:hypothetical protein
MQPQAPFHNVVGFIQVAGFCGQEFIENIIVFTVEKLDGNGDC